jgi:hypothetical protein
MQRTATFVGSVSASFVIEQQGLPKMESTSHGETWNGDLPHERLRLLKARHG